MWRYVYTDELYHYGVKGMKWGIRRYQNEDGTLTALGKQRREFNVGKERVINTAKNVVSSPITIVKATPRILLNEVLPGGAMVANLVADTANLVVGNLDRKRQNKNRMDLSQIKKKESSSTVFEDLKEINRGYGIKYGHSKNCGNCTIAMELRRRGYDVKASRNEYGIYFDELSKWYKNVELKTNPITKSKGESKSSYIKRSYDQLCTSLEKYGDGARGYLGVVYEKGGGHAMYWENSNSKTRIYDPQRNKVDPYDIFLAADPAQHHYARLDNCKIQGDITELIKNRE